MGFIAQAAEVKLKELLEVTSLKDVTKGQATAFIDRLLNEHAVGSADGQH